MKVEDVAPKIFAERFYRRYQKRDTKNETSQEWVMEPVVEVVVKPKKEKKVLDGTVLIPTPLSISNNPDTSKSETRSAKIELPKDQSLKSLLQWFTMAEEAAKN